MGALLFCALSGSGREANQNPKSGPRSTRAGILSGYLFVQIESERLNLASVDVDAFPCRDKWRTAINGGGSYPTEPEAFAIIETCNESGRTVLAVVGYSVPDEKEK